MPTSTAFWDRSVQEYAATPVKDKAAYVATLARTRAHLHARDEVLEIGCGTGTTAFKLAENVARYTATDISEEMIKRAEGKRDGAIAHKIRFMVATLDDHPFSARSFNAVLAFNVLHLLKDLSGSLKEVHSLLKPGGVFISKTICLSERPFYYQLIIPFMRLFGKSSYVRFMDSGELKKAIERAGFEIIETDYYPKHARSRFIVARKRD